MASPSGILRYPYEAITDTTDYLQITIKKNKRLGDGDKEKYWVDNYEPPLKDFYMIDTTDQSIEESVDEILDVCR